MSINVNVSGNPVSIKRGKLVTSDYGYNDEEFQKRRRIRLEQVRQQSKNIAEQVRNKVRDENSKHLLDFEKQGEKEFQKWQARKLLSLQQQYRECLNDIGLGHAQAVLEEESDIEYENLQEDYKQLANERGNEASKKVQGTKLETQSAKINALQKKKLLRGIENTRSKMVSSLNKNSKSPFKKPKHGKLTTDITISRRLSKNDTENESVTDEPILLNVSSTTSVTSKGEPQYTGKSVLSTATLDQHSSNTKIPEELEHSKNQAKQNAPEEIPASVAIPENRRDYYVNTRISDRIKNRPNFRKFEPTNSNVCELTIPTACKCCCQQDINPSVTSVNQDAKIERPEELKNEIPPKPTVTLRTSHTNTTVPNLSKVQYCDYKNRYNKDYILSQPTIEHISEESLEVCPSSRSEVEYVERMYKRDQEAEERGKKALQKEKVHRDYKDIMQQLPLLQKQERIASISSNKPTFHMSDDRLKKHEKKHQMRMENAYEHLFPKPRVITIPRKEIPKRDSNLPFQTVSVDSSNPPVLDVGSWDFDIQFNARPHVDARHASSDLIQEAVNKDLDKSDPEMVQLNRREQLQEMWKSLTEKRKKLAKEINELPGNSRLRTMLSEVGGLDQYLKVENPLLIDKATETSITELITRKTSKRSKDSTSGSASQENNGAAVTNNNEKTNLKPNCMCTADSSSTPTEPSKKSKIRTKLHRKHPPLILQNTSTQTTPTLQSKSLPKSKEVFQSVPLPSIAVDQEIISNNITSINLGKNLENKQPMCQIVIKIDDDGKPVVSVDPAKLNDKEIIVKTGIKHTSPRTHEILQSNPSKAKTEKTLLPKEILKEKPEPSKTKLYKTKDNVNHQTSWNDYFSQNSTSTSYYSPPDPTFKVPVARSVACPGTIPHHLSGILRDKPQQRNVQNTTNTSSATLSNSGSNKKTDVCPLMCIKKLLSMSRRSIEELQVSAVSDVSTPGSSIIKTKSNVNTKRNKGNNLKDQSTEKPCASSVSDSTTPTLNNVSTSIEEYCATNYPDVMEIYHKLAENCAKKIEYLSSLLEKNRLEKLNLISPSTSGSDRDASTKYLSLPQKLKKQVMDTSKSKKDTLSSSSTEEQEELNRQLLEIDYGLVERLKGMTPTEISKQFSAVELSVSESSNESDIDKTLIERFKKLVDSHADSADNVTVQSTSFTPLLIDLPSLPTFEPKPFGFSYQTRCKPPPSKGLTVARRFNNNIDTTPHQLSTIAESETLTALKIPKINTPENLELLPVPLTSDPVKLQGPAKLHQVYNETKSTSSNDSLPDILTEVMQDVKQAVVPNDQQHGKSTDSGSEIVEAMLESLGIGSWALATLRKTQESLAIPSDTSSSSNSKHQLIDSSSPSNEALLKELAVSKVDESGGSLQFIKDLTMLDKATRRTSTPVQNSDKSKSKSDDFEASGSKRNLS